MRAGPSEQSTSTAPGITEAGAGAQGVGDVLGDAIVGEHGGGDATLGEAGVAVFQPRLGDQRDRVLAAELERSDEPGDAAANDDDVLHATPRASLA